MRKHLGIYCNNAINKSDLYYQITHKNLLQESFDISTLKGEIVSAITISKLIDEEFKYDRFIISKAYQNTSIESMSSGQQKMALIEHTFKKELDYIILDDIHSNIDKKTLDELINLITTKNDTYTFIQIFDRKEDILSFIDQVITIDQDFAIKSHISTIDFLLQTTTKINLKKFPFHRLKDITFFDPIIDLKKVNVSYLDKPVLKDLSWTIKRGEFWELSGPIGSGKSTLLSMIIGDNPKAFGQDITLFGIKKGSGETVWEIKKHIGYFYTKMLQLFSRNYTNEEMIISGFYDSIGLYTKSTDLQIKIASDWLDFLGPEYREKKFQNLSTGQQRVIMLVRAIVKQPTLLILDEPTVGLDDQNAQLFVALLNTIASQKEIAIIFVSHRKEQGLQTDFVLELVPSNEGSNFRKIDSLQ